MLELSDDQKLQLLLVGGPILSLIGTWMSLRTYGRLKQKKQLHQPVLPEAGSGLDARPGVDHPLPTQPSRSEHADRG